MRILITGGCGFQGSHLVDRWLEAGHEITILNTLSPQNSQNIAHVASKVQIVWGSITDREIVSKTVRAQDVVVHLAARIHVDESVGSPDSTVAVNVLGTQNILEAARKNQTRVIHASSCEVYGSAQPIPVTEESGLMPHSPYAASKAAADRLCFAYFKTYGLPVTIVRPCNIYGERQKDGVAGALIPIFVRKALEGKPLTIFGTGLQRREYMHVQDLVECYDLVLRHPELAGETLNCGTGETISVREIGEFIADRLNVALEHGPARPGEVPEFLLDSSKARRLGFSPQVKFWDGLERYIRWRTQAAAGMATSAASSATAKG